MQFPILFVEAIADPETNTIEGVAQPFVMVTANIEHPKGTYTGRGTVADAEGNFSFDFSSSVDWDYGDHFWIGQFVHANRVINVTNDSPHVQIVQPPIETDRYVVTTFSALSYVDPSAASLMMDFDSDGDLDLVVPQFPELSAVLAFRNDGSGNFTDETAEVFGGITVETITARHWAVADFNGDGRDDLFIADHGPDHDPFPGGQSLILIQNDSGQLINETAARLPQQLAFTHSTAAGDIDGDGDVDIYVGNISGSDLGPRIYINDGSGFFTDDTTRIPAILTNRQKKYTSSLLLDVDKDGDLDLVLGGHGGFQPDESLPYDALLLNDGAGFFTFAPDTSLPPRLGGPEAGTVAMSSGDFDNDGWPDLVMSTHSNYSDPTNMFLQLLLNNGDGSFRDETFRIDQDWPAYLTPGCDGGWGDYWLVWPFVVDSNDDGWPDILVQGAMCVMHLLFESVGGERFEVVENLSEIERHTPNYPWALVPGDIDGDGDEDIILLYPHSAHHQVLLRK